MYYFFAECPFLALYIKSAIGTQCVMGRITQCVMGRTTQCVMGRITLRLFKPDFGGKHLFTLFVQIISS